MAAFALGARTGWRMFECDVKLSADEVAFLLHDADLERTTNGQGLAGRLDWAALAQLDAGQWHSPAYAGEPLCTLEALSAWCLERSLLLNIEIKPTPGLERETGRAVATEARRLWATQADRAPLLTSFQPESLRGALETAPELHRGLLLHKLWEGWLDAARELGCAAIVCHQDLWTEDTSAQVQAAGMRRLAYTVNEEGSASRLLALRLDGIITDRVDGFVPVN